MNKLVLLSNKGIFNGILTTQKININGKIYCRKCNFRLKLPIKGFKNLYSIYRHYIRHHSNQDKNLSPSRDECIAELVALGNILGAGILR